MTSGDPVAAPHIWNGLPNDLISADSLLTFRQLLKCFFIMYFILDYFNSLSRRYVVLLKL